jgi:hypothetical protein
MAYRQLLTLLNQIPEQRPGLIVIDEGACGDWNFYVLTIRPSFIIRSPTASILSLILLLVSKSCQSIQIGIHYKDNIAALAPIPAVGSASWDIFFPSEMDHAAPAFSRRDKNSRLI